MVLKAIEKVFHIYQPEFSRTAYAWLIKALFKIGLIIGWTTVIAIFVERFSISALPVLFLAQATLIISGMMLFSFVLDRYETRWLVAGCGIAASIFLFTATFFYEQNMVFFPLVLVASGIFLPQISIFLSSYIEDFFTPAECARTFPVIESAETIGGIIGGLVLASQIPFFAGYRLFFIWIILIFAFLGVLFLMHPRTTSFYSYLYEMKIIPVSSKMTWNGIAKSLKEIRRLPFLQILIVVVFTQWLTAHLLEFQYTKIVDESLSASSGADHSEGLAHGLGLLHMIFSGSALVVQLLLTSRLLSFLGTFGGFLFHSLITLMSSLSMLFGFGYFTTVLAKNNFEVSGIVSRNAYEASYYAFKHGTQKSIREFFEGFIAPAGTIVATLLLLLIRMFFVDKDSLLVINVMLVLLPVFALSISIYMQKCYTDMVRQNLAASGKKIAKLHAIEILAQKGHRHSVEILVSALRMEDDTDIHLKIMGVLRKIGDIRAIPAIEEKIFSDEPRIVVSAIHTMANFPGIRKKRHNLIYTRQKFIDDLKVLFGESTDVNVKAAILKALPRLDDNAAGFILDVLKKAEPLLQAVCIRQMSLSGDPAVLRYLKPYLSSDDPFVRANAVAGLYRMKHHDAEMETIIGRLLAAKERDEILAACSALWILKNGKVKTMLKKHLRSQDEFVRLYAATGLLKCGVYGAAQTLADLLLGGNDLILNKAKARLKNLDTGARKIVAECMQIGILKKAGLNVNNGLRADGMLRIMGEEMLESLQRGYLALGAGDEAELINTILEYRKSAQKNIQSGLTLSPVISS